jgi:hypothetical protein
MPRDREYNEVRYNLHEVTGRMNYHMELFGDEFAQRNGYKAHNGLDAVHFYLIQKHGWLPRDVRTMSLEDIRFVLEEEMKGWTVPAEGQIRPKQALGASAT